MRHQDRVEQEKKYLNWDENGEGEMDVIWEVGGRNNHLATEG